MLLSLIMLAAGPLLLILGMRWFKGDDLQDRLSEFVVEQPTKTKT